ncbi:MAG: murein biosynthesis integral membrane protein MurJ [Desulfobacteraceae bacterium]|nr:murein biosynthesis integral membrane protein MurJ [Desulfobacteraceae bacterium]
MTEPENLLKSESSSEESRRFTRAAGVVGASTLLSRFFGYARDLAIASMFGTGLASDAFFMAFSIPNLMRRLFAEGSLGVAFVPVFSGYLSNKGRKEAFDLAGAAFRFVALVTALVSVAGIWFAPEIIKFMAFGWSDLPNKLNLCVRLTRWMLPYVFLISIAAHAMSVLNVLEHFAAPALAPVCLNISMIGAIVTGSVMAAPDTELIQWLAVGVLIGGALQFAIQIPFLRKNKVSFCQSIKLWHPGLSSVFRLFIPTLVGASVYQINSLVLRLLASLLPHGSVSCLYYADRLVQFPLGLFGIATATAVLPTLSRQSALRNWSGVRDTFAFAMRLVLFVTLPAMVGLVVLREPIVKLLFQRGAFNPESMRLTAGAVLYYGVGLWAFSVIRIVLNVFYALQDARTPMLGGVLAVIANILLSLILMRYMQHNGLALALSLASIINLAWLLVALQKKLGSLRWRRIARSAVISLSLSAIMGFAVWACARWSIPALEDAAFIPLFCGILFCICAGLIVFGGLSYLLKVPELQTMLQLFLRKGIKSES